MSDLKRRQFIDEEVKPVIRVELPKILERMDQLEIKAGILLHEVSELAKALNGHETNKKLQPTVKEVSAIAALSKARSKKAKTSKK